MTREERLRSMVRVLWDYYPSGNICPFCSYFMGGHEPTCDMVRLDFARPHHDFDAPRETSSVRSQQHFVARKSAERRAE